MELKTTMNNAADSRTDQQLAELKTLSALSRSITSTLDLSLVLNQIVDAAAGLGDHVTITGLSGGGVIAGWLAQQRPEIDQAVLIGMFDRFQIWEPGRYEQTSAAVAARAPDAFRLI